MSVQEGLRSKVAEAADANLREQVRELTAAMAKVEEAGELGTWRLDPLGGNVEVSTWLRVTLGLEPRMTLETVLGTLFGPGDADRAREVISQAVIEHLPFTITNLVPTRHGERMWFRHRGEPLFDEGGNLIAFEGVSQRIDQVMKANEEREMFHRTLQQVQRDESSNYLAGGLAHELSNLLQPALLLCERTRSSIESGDVEKAVRFVERVETSIERAGDVLRSAADFARLDPDKLVPVTSDEVLTDLATFLDPQLADQVDLEMSEDLRGIAFMATRAGVVQLVLNILKNASQAAGPNSRILVRVLLEPDVDHPESETLIFRFIDDGPGFTPEALRRAFDPRFTTRFGTGGNGLGLSVVRTMVEHWGGAISIGNNVDGGGCVELRAPIVRTAP